MVDNHILYGGRNEKLSDNRKQFGSPYRTNINDSNFDYYRSSSSSSSSGSGKILVQRPHISPYTATSRYNPIFKEELTSANLSSLNLEHNQAAGNFYIGGYLRPPSSPKLHGSTFYPPDYNGLQSSGQANPGLLTVPQFTGLEATHGKLSHNFLTDTSDSKSSKIGAVPETFWQIPRANLWCSHNGCSKEGPKCSQCESKEETTSNCSSENPPPTFTALDNIHPIKRRKRWCKCAITCLTTTTFCILILSIIGGYIVYVEVLKRNQYIPEPM